MNRGFVLRWLAVAVILAIILVRTDLGAFEDALSETPAEVWASVIGLNLAYPALASIRSRLVLRRLGYDVRPGLLFPVMTLGFVVGSLTPAGSGELLRLDALNAKAGVKLEDGMGLILFERLLSFYFMALLAALLGAALLLPLVFAAIAVAICAALFLLPLFAGTLLTHLPAPGEERNGHAWRVLRFVRESIGQIEYVSQDRWLVVTWSLITLAILGIAGLQYWIIADSLGDGISFWEALLTYCATQFLGIITLLPLGLGVTDASLVGIVSRSGLSQEQALGMAVLARAMVTVPLVVLALACFVYLALQRRTDTREAPIRTSDVAPGSSAPRGET